MNPQGIYTLVSQGKALERKMEAVANNLANTDTVGYKADQPTFETILTKAYGVARESDEEIFFSHDHLAPYSGIGTPYVAVADMGINNAQGRLVNTNNKLDFALVNRDGYFSVNTPQGERFTRAGNFRMATDNRLITAEGFQVNGKEGPLTLTGTAVEVTEDGSVLVDGERVGGMKIVTFPFPERLQKLGNSMFAPADAANTPRILENVQMVQGAVESSNVEAVKEMVSMITANRAYSSMQRALQTADAMNESAVSLAQI